MATGKPTITPGPAAGSGAAASLSATSNDGQGLITLTTGPGAVLPPNGIAATFTYSAPFDTAPNSIILTPASASAAPPTDVFIDSTAVTANQFTLNVAALALQPVTTYQWYYQIMLL